MDLFISFIIILRFVHVITTNKLSLTPMQNNAGSFGYFNSEIVTGYKLSIQPILTLFVQDEFECLEHCLEDDNTCLTFNVLEDISTGQKQCELLDTDAFFNFKSFLKDNTSTHYGLQTKCWEKPCSNCGLCVPDYSTNSFKCNCTGGSNGKLCQQPLPAESSCRKFYDKGQRTDCIYPILFEDTNIKDIFCDMENGGWTVIQRRMDGSVDFNKNWQEYKEGFGDSYGEYWLGNGAFHQLTKNSCQLNISMVYKGTDYYAYYSSFQISDESSKYTLHVDGFQGNVDDDLGSIHNNMAFTTPDVDNDLTGAGNCGAARKGGWWFNACQRVFLNGKFGMSPEFENGIQWRSVTGIDTSLDSVEMKILYPS